VREAYLQLAQADQSLAQQRWHIINAKQEIEAIEQEIWQVVQAKLSAKQADEAES
jgi:thymidylate kinase